jgi:hypothetical protein
MPCSRLCIAALIVSGCASPAPPPAAAPDVTPKAKDDDAIALVLVVESAGSAEDERSGAEHAFRERLASSSRFTMQPVPGADIAPLRLRLRVGGVESAEGGMRQKLVLTGATHDGACQVFQFAPVLTKPGAKPGDATARRELLDTGLGDLISKLEASSTKLGNATCLATGPTR